MAEENKYLKIMIIAVIGLVGVITTYGIYINAASSEHVEKMVDAQHASLSVDIATYHDINPTWAKTDISVRSKWMIDVQAQLDGTVKEVYVEPGQKIKAGQLLLSIENVDLPAKIAQADAMVLQAQASLLRSEQLLARYTQLVAADAISKKDYDDAVASVTIAKSELAANIAQRKSLAINQNKTDFFAPKDGIVISVYCKPGYFIRSGETGMLLGDFSDFYILTTFSDEHLQTFYPDNDLFALEINKHLLIDKSYPFSHDKEHIVAVNNDETNRKIIVQIEEISPSMNISSNFRNIKWKVISGHNFLEPTTYPNVKFVGTKAKRALSISKMAIDSITSPHVFVVNSSNRLELKNVRLGIEDDFYFEILEGLKEGEVVVTSNHLGLSDGMNVRIKK